MTSELKRLLRTASLLSLLMGASAAIAQAERPWVDPPSEAGAQPQTAVPSQGQPAQGQPAQGQPAPPATSDLSKPVSPSSDADKAPASQTGQTDKSTDTAQSQSPSVAPQPKPTVKKQTPRRSVVERKTRAPSREASSGRNVRQRASAVRRGPVGSTGSIEASQTRNRRTTRFETVQEGVDSGLELMRMRTIQFPDGRRITILTRPEPGTLSGLADEPY